MKNCREKYFDLIEDYVEGELNFIAAAQVETHLSACSACRRQIVELERESEIYANYLPDFAPPEDSWNDLQKRIADEKRELLPNEEKFHRPAPRRRIFAFRFSPAWAGFALLLIISAVALVWLEISPLTGGDDNSIAETQPMDFPSLSIEETKQNEPRDFASETINRDFPAPKEGKKNYRKQPRPNKKDFVVENSYLKPPVSQAKPINSKQNSKDANLIGKEREEKILRVENLQTEIGEQIEKVEMLLRSFRNAQVNEISPGFDVEYEKRQARRLLQKVKDLRREAEINSMFDAEELLSRVEPYLLEIANLEINPTAERVSEINGRVNSQKIIASLQVYR